MVQMLIILLVLAVFLNDTIEVPTAIDSTESKWIMGMWITSLILSGLLYLILSKITYLKLGTGKERSTLKRFDRFTMVYRILITGITFGAMIGGTLNIIRNWFGSFFYIPDLIFIAPAIGLYIWGWMCHYPIDRRLRESSLIRMIDDDQTISNLPSMRTFIFNHVRHEVLLVLVPLMLILLWAQLTEFVFLPWLYEGNNSNALDMLSQNPNEAIDTGTAITMLGAVSIFVMTPLLVRWVWDTTPLAHGTVRDRLTNLCKQHRVGVSEMLLWRTTGTMINAAVIGISSKLRYILLSDALLDMMPTRQLEAVMAHEIAHIRKKHIFWLIISAISLIGSLEFIFTMIFEQMSNLISTLMVLAGSENGVWQQYLPAQISGDDLIFLLAILCTLSLWVILFGYISRIAERQADTFAAKHMTKVLAAEKADNDQQNNIISSEGAMIMISALQLVADLNHMPTQKHNWRHGSIIYRQDYLRTLIGKDMNNLDVDRKMRWVNLGCLALLVLTLVAQYWLVY
ncbi:M48 family metalloprotease [Planctomycetota bacterium]|nr:M48 family metalloprotease [Planctomycetota bacterium]